MGTLIASLSTKTEKDITINWVSEYNLSQLCYSLNNGQSYILSDQTGTSGFLSFYDLEPNTLYKMILKGTERGSSQIIYSEVLEVNTYDFPHCIEAPDFSIGEKLTLKFYNPLSREITVNLLGVDGSVISNDTISGTTLTGFLDETVKDRLYRSIPNNSAARYSVKTTYESEFSKTVTGGFYSVNPNDCAPLLGDVFYEDRDPLTVTITGNNQLIVRNRSLPFFTANGISARKYATVSSVKVFLNEEEYNLTLTGETATGLGSAVNSSTSLYAVFTVTDSRGLVTQKEKLVHICDWFEPETLIDLKRTNDGSGGTIKVDVNYASVESLNSLTLDYYKKKRTDSDYTYGGTLTNGVATTFLADASYDWDVKVAVKDRFSGVKNYVKTLSRYTPLIFFDAEKYSVGVNCFPTNNGTLEVKGEDVYDALFYSSGESFSFTDKKVYFPGIFRDSGIYFSIALPKSIKNVTPSVSTLKVNACKNSNGYFYTSDSYTTGGYDVLANSGTTTTCSKQNDHTLLVTMQRNTPVVGETNNSQVIVEVNALGVDFSAV